MRTEALSLDQAPPLGVPVAYYLCAPAALLAAGALLVAEGLAALGSSWGSATLALVHLGALGFLGCVMMGSLLQMIPVILGSPVPGVRLAWGALGLWGLGVGALTWGLYRGLPEAVQLGRLGLGLGLGLWWALVGWAAARSRPGGAVGWGMRLALGSLALAAALGLWMAAGHVGGVFPGDRARFIAAHAALGVLGWLGGLVTAVSWKVLPMFYLASQVGPRAQALVLGGLVLGALGTPAALALGQPAWPAVVGGLVLWGLHPVLVWRSTRGGRRRADPSRRAWGLAMGLGPIVALAGLGHLLGQDPRWGLCWGWLALWGWAGLLVHGMLSRIVPFLVWFHRWSHRVGLEKTPSMRELLPDRVVLGGLALHAGSVGLGVLAILTRSDTLARAAGVLVVLTALALWVELGVALRPRAPGAA